MPGVPPRTREGSVVRALPGLVGVLVLCAGTLAASSAELADGSALHGPDAVAAASPSSPQATPTPTPPAAPASEVPITGTRPGVTAAEPAPVRLEIADLGVEMEVAPVGVAADQTMEIPPEVDVAGWYRFGAAPGAGAGSTVLAAHVDSRREGLGPFAALPSTRTGAEVVVTTDDGTEHRYQVQEVEQVPRSELPLDRVFARTGGPQLVLITCGGPFDPRSGYRDNVVLTALPVDG